MNWSSWFRKTFHDIQDRKIDTLSIYWQGGEVMTQSPEWFARAHALVQGIATARGRRIVDYLQSNMIGYGRNGIPLLPRCSGTAWGLRWIFPISTAE